MNSYNSQFFGGSAEECHSSESGWTMYIGSPVDDDYVDEAENDDEDHYKGGGDVESDDSMVSDASSAMTSNIKKTNVYHQDAKKDVAGKMKSSRKSMKIRVEEIEKPDKRKDKESANMNAATSRSGNKVRRNWLGKKK
ncbi:hypothetical protein AgCh_026772 [Apium graveolens]